MGKKWQYKVVKLEVGHQEELLNSLGEEGWYLCSVVTLVTPGGDERIQAYLKRAKA